MKHLLLAFVAFIALDVCGQKSPHETVTTDNVSVTYGRPYKKGREIFGGLEKFGSVWRLGADQATQITFKKDGKFGTADVKAGTYTLFAALGETEWTFILNSELGQWGAFSYEKNKAKDVGQVKVPVKKLDKEVEQLTIAFPSASLMTVEWDKTHVEVPLKF
ncbi:MAG: DUF2911 domain-containing protein [Chitinophagaceae bacterium]